MHNVYSNMDDDEMAIAKRLLDQFADAVAVELTARGFRSTHSLIFRPCSIAFLRDVDKKVLAFARTGGAGTPSRFWLHHDDETVPDSVAFLDMLQNEYDWNIGLQVDLPGNPPSVDAITQAAAHHAEEVSRSMTFAQLGDTSHVRHLDEHLKTFLADHPSYDRNVFVMMRFNNSPQLEEVFKTIKDTLAAKGMNAVRASDRDYTSELWTNVEVYLTGCKYGIAVFEDIDERDFNPNVSLELGYLMGRGKRTLLLKEKRLRTLPADVVHRLYKAFDSYDIPTTVAAEVARWIDVDLKLAHAPASGS
ncbi:hypothetical protein A2J03_22245 [Rhodococcus sp. EPR-157]|nr:hypothetical protein A2J03_22245 [Rhodococcus sp. EPR-157]